jgi:hypothetical protein
VKQGRGLHRLIVLPLTVNVKVGLLQLRARLIARRHLLSYLAESEDLASPAEFASTRHHGHLLYALEILDVVPAGVL